MAATTINEQEAGALEAILDDLRRLTAPLTEPDARHYLERLSVCASQLSPFERFHSTVYRRNSFFRTDFVELVLLCWKSGQRTPIHDHTGSLCGVFVVHGEATEIAFARSGIGLLTPMLSRELRPGQITVGRDDYMHLMGNFSESREDLVTLHCYTPPLDRMKVYPQSETVFAEYEELRGLACKSGAWMGQI